MENKKQKEARIKAKYYTVEELLDAGNKVQYIATETLIMTCGKITTHYNLKDWEGDKYWHPIANNKTQKHETA